MKIKFLIIFIFASFFSITHADDHVEIGGMAAMQCQIADGADMDDVMKVLAEWDEYGDDNFSEPFSAWIMTPVYMSTADFDLDFVFLGFSLHQKNILAGCNERSCSIEKKSFFQKKLSKEKDFLYKKIQL